jgi:hypothetical protein
MAAAKIDAMKSLNCDRCLRMALKIIHSFGTNIGHAESCWQAVEIKDDARAVSGPGLPYC